MVTRVTYSRASYLIEILTTLTPYVISVMKVGRLGHARERTEVCKKKLWSETLKLRVKFEDFGVG
jgi:hypothetical protein